jgi:hypothetical protein
MYQPLAPCTACRRHVRATEAACPFCGGAIGVARNVMPEGRLSRAGLAVFAMAIAGCTEPTREPASPDPIAKPAVDAGAVAQPTPSPTPPPSPEGVGEDAGLVDDPGTMHAKYGAAPPPPKPPPPHVTPVPAYGLPPKPLGPPKL